MEELKAPAANIKSEKPATPKTRRKKTPKKITATYLHNSGLYYLQRFSASSRQFRDVMIRKVKKSCFAHKDQNFEECTALVDELVEKFTKTGLLDDELYTRGVVESLRRQGKSRKAIHHKLQSKGIEKSLIEKYMLDYDTNRDLDPIQSELRAGLIFARKKKIGPYKNQDKEEDSQKALASLARTGFSYDIAKTVLETSLEEAEEITRR